LIGFGFDPHKLESKMEGTIAPGFVLAGLDGERITLSDLQGKPVVLNFWATWCAPCKYEHPGLVALSRQLAGKAHFVGVVFEDEPAVIQKFLDDNGRWGPALLDTHGSASVAYGVTGIPETFIIDKQGMIAKKFTGPVSPAEILKSLEEHL